MRLLVYTFIFLALAGCGGTPHGHNAVSNDPIRLISSGESALALDGAATVPSGTNAALTTLDLTHAYRFLVDDYRTPVGATAGFHLQDSRGRLLNLTISSPDQTLVAGAAYEFQGMTTLDYEEDGTGRAFRTWSAQGGSVVVDSVDEDAVRVHVSGVRMVPGTEERGGDFPTVKDSAKGEFVLDLQASLPLSKGQVSFADGGGTPFDGRTVDPLSGTLAAYSNAREIDVRVEADDTDPYRSHYLLLQLFKSSGTVQAGDVFVLDGRQSAGSAVDYGDDGSHIWLARSGTATVRAIQGRVVTLELSKVALSPYERASGTIEAGGTVTVLVP